MAIGTNIGFGYSAAYQKPQASRGNFDSHAHSVQFYEEDIFLLDDLGHFIGSALAAGDVGVVIATQAHLDGLAERLTERGLDVGLAVSQGRYVPLDATETLEKFMVDGRPHPARFFDVVGSVIAEGVRTAGNERGKVLAFGEMVALLWADGNPEGAIELEKLWNDLAATQTFSLRCAYPMRLFAHTRDGEPLLEICSTHSHVVPSESYTSLADEGARLGAIAILQQKAQALEAEIEEREKAQKALHERNRELREAIAARDEFLSVAAHELKTPLTSLRGFVQLLLRSAQREREGLPDRVNYALNAIEQQTGKLAGLVARLLDTGQIEAGKLRIELMRTDLAELVHSVVAQQKGITTHTFIYDGPEHLEAMVDPVRFEQVISNLLDNAAKYSPEGGSVTIELSQGSDGSIRLCVIDEGIGIPVEEREEVFERFHQAHGEGHLSGMGLGLYIAREIVELHGGYLRIEEPQHRGSRFVVTLPPFESARPKVEN